MHACMPACPPKQELYYLGLIAGHLSFGKLRMNIYIYIYICIHTLKVGCRHGAEGHMHMDKGFELFCFSGCVDARLQ